MRRTAFWIVIVLTAVAPTTLRRPATAATIVLDAMSAPLEPSPCLPLTHAPIVFLGPACDGANCPPDPWATSWTDCSVLEQDGLPGVLSPRRGALVSGPMDGSVDVLRIQPGSPLAEFSTSDGSGLSWFVLSYGDPSSTWHVDLSGLLGMTFDLRGDVSAGRPARAYVSLFNEPALSGTQSMAWGEVTFTATGPATVPYAALDRDPEFDLSRVIRIEFNFSECSAGECSALPARSFSIGPIACVTDAPTPALHRTWGALKAAYR